MRRYPVIIVCVAMAMFAACARQAQNNQNVPAVNQSPTNSSAAPTPADNTPPLLREINNGNTEAARELINNGANVNAANETGVTPLINAAGMGNKEIVQLLLSRGADVNAKASGNYTALMQAALVGQTEIVKILLDAGADPTVKDIAGRTAQIYAEEKGHKDIVAMLKARK